MKQQSQRFSLQLKIYTGTSPSGQIFLTGLAISKARMKQCYRYFYTGHKQLVLHYSQLNSILFLSIKQVKLETLYAALGPVAAHSTVILLAFTVAPSLTRCSEHTGQSAHKQDNIMY